jgi:MFS family permease
MVAGISTLVVMPLIGKLSDKIDKFKIFAMACAWMIIMVTLYTNLSVTPLWLVIVFNVLMMAGIMSRMIPSSALVSAIPVMEDRGAFMSINASLQQIAGGIAAAIGGLIVVQKNNFSPLEHYNILGYIVVAVTIVSLLMVYRVSNVVKKKTEENLAEKKPVVSMEA